MRIVIAGNAVVVESLLTKEDFNKAMTYAPDALTVVDENNDEVFRVSQGAASISKYGITFDGATESGNVTATLLVGTTEDVKEQAKKDYGVALAVLASCESMIKDAIAEQSDAVDAVFATLDAEEEEV